MRWAVHSEPARSIVAELPSAIAGTLELGRQGALSTGLILGVIVMAVDSSGVGSGAISGRAKETTG